MNNHKIHTIYWPTISASSSATCTLATPILTSQNSRIRLTRIIWRSEPPASLVNVLLVTCDAVSSTSSTYLGRPSNLLDAVRFNDDFANKLWDPQVYIWRKMKPNSFIDQITFNFLTLDAL